MPKSMSLLVVEIRCKNLTSKCIPKVPHVHCHLKGLLDNLIPIRKRLLGIVLETFFLVILGQIIP